MLVLAGGLSLEEAPPHFFPFFLFLVPFFLVAFLVIGVPLFLVLRGTRWFRFPLGACVGAAVGVVASALFGAPSLDLLSIGFAAVGALSTAVCWLVLRIRPNIAFKIRRSSSTA